MTPAPVQVTCCTQLGSTAQQINGTLGCPYTPTTFSDTNSTKTAWLACCKTNNCDAELCTEGGIDTPYPDPTSSSASDDTNTDAPTATPTGKPNSAISRRGFQAAFVGLFLADILVSALVHLL
jgi:hypothetical protein